MTTSTSELHVRFRSSIHAKLIGLIAVLIAAIVAFVTAYFSAQTIDALHEEQLARVGTYGDLLSGQLRSAIAFSDRETAREVLSGLDAERDLAGAALFDDRGAALYQRGTPSDWIGRARQGVVAKRAFQFDDRAAVVVPVSSLEGPRGTLVIELSMERLTTRQHAVIRMAVLIGCVVLLFGVLIASLIARTFVRRLRAIGKVATEVAAGSDEHREIATDSRDEIGVLAIAFQRMLAQLDARVAHRTSELLEANEQLQDEMTRRSVMEIELRQAQKLESVGRLATGIAHEINTPLQYAGDSIQFARDAVGQLIALVPSSAADDDITFLVEEMPAALERALDGLGRVNAIVQSMKQFAHPGSTVIELDINRAITSTLSIARNEYKYVAEVETDFGELPLVACYAGEVNQVLLNVLINAAHAIAEATANTSLRGTIRIRTQRDGEHVVVSITDTGGGIPEHVRDRIFEPFFTTKPVGKGTGQGLAIARAVIVDKHAGSLTFDSVVGSGTTFRIQIPIRMRNATSLLSAA